jgi:hypothetical protein
MSKELTEDPDTIVSDAEAKAGEAEALVTAIEDRIVAGDDSVTHADLSEQISLARFARKLVDAAKTKAQGIREAQQKKALKDLKSEILEKSTANGDDLLKEFDTFYGAICRFVDKADAEDLNVSNWVKAATALDVPDKGAVSAAHENIGTSAGGDILINNIRLQKITAANVLRLVINDIQNGYLPNRSEADVNSARSIVANHGKASV